MLLRTMLFPKGKQVLELLKPCTTLFPRKYSSVTSTIDISQSPDSSPAKHEKPKKPSFMKNVFLGEFDRTFLEYPGQRKAEFSSNTQEFYSKASNYFNESDKILNSFEKFMFLAGNGLFCLNYPEIYDGSSTMHAEMLLLFEKLELESELAVLMEAHYSFIIPTLIKYGSPELKKLYLDKLLKGEITGAYAMAEESSASDPTALKLGVIEKDTHFILNGGKIWVTNAMNADFYLTFGSVDFENWKLRETLFAQDLSVFLVSKSDKVEIKKHDLCGLNDCGIGELKFSNHEVPLDHLVGNFNDGYNIAREAVTKHKFISLASILCSLKGLVTSLTSIVNSKEPAVYHKNNEHVKMKILNLVRVIYCLESMLYFTAHNLDTYDIDTNLESALLQIYAFDTAIKTVTECLKCFGSKVYDNRFPYGKLLQVLKGLSLHATNVDISKLLVSLTGLEHVGNNLNETIKMNRDPFNFPVFMFKKLLTQQNPLKDPKLTLKLYLEIHPTLKDATDLLEASVLRLKLLSEFLLSRHGNEIVNRQLDLERLADIALNIFVMTSVLSRASHSFCTGVQNCDDEVRMAMLVCHEASNNIKRRYDHLISFKDETMDVLSLKLGSTILNKESYFFEHPLNHSI